MIGTCQDKLMSVFMTKLEKFVIACVFYWSI